MNLWFSLGLTIWKSFKTQLFYNTRGGQARLGGRPPAVSGLVRRGGSRFALALRGARVPRSHLFARGRLVLRARIARESLILQAKMQISWNLIKKRIKTTIPAHYGNQSNLIKFDQTWPEWVAFLLLYKHFVGVGSRGCQFLVHFPCSFNRIDL